MAGGAIIRKHGLAKGKISILFGRQTGEGADIIRSRRDFSRLQNTVATKGGHHARPCILVGIPPDTMLQGGVDGIKRAAPQPVIIVQVRVAFKALCASTMAGRAIHRKSSRALRTGKGEKFRRLLDICERSRLDFGVHWRAQRLQAFEIGHHGIARMPAKRALGKTRDQRNRGVNNPVPERPEDAGIKRPQPPPRQRIVQFLNAIPFMARGADNRFFFVGMV